MIGPSRYIVRFLLISVTIGKKIRGAVEPVTAKLPIVCPSKSKPSTPLEHGHAAYRSSP